jgi:hypothetical protein
MKPFDKLTTKQKGKIIIYAVMIVFVLIGSAFIISGDIMTGVKLWMIGSVTGLISVILLIWKISREK